jgi:hypothetical protein
MLPLCAVDDRVQPPCVDTRFTDEFGVKRDSDTVSGADSDDVTVRQ